MVLLNDESSVQNHLNDGLASAICRLDRLEREFSKGNSTSNQLFSK